MTSKPSAGICPSVSCTNQMYLHATMELTEQRIMTKSHKEHKHVQNNHGIVPPLGRLTHENQLISILLLK